MKLAELHTGMRSVADWEFKENSTQYKITSPKKVLESKGKREEKENRRGSPSCFPRDAD
jgi:hypothetical protein